MSDSEARVPTAPEANAPAPVNADTDSAMEAEAVSEKVPPLTSEALTERALRAKAIVRQRLSIVSRQQREVASKLPSSRTTYGSKSVLPASSRP